MGISQGLPHWTPPCSWQVRNLKRHFKKAFDCVNHDILPNKLQHQFGIHSPPSNWLTSYLTLKQQYMVLNGQRLSLYSVSSGTSQGSVLRGPCYWPYTQVIFWVDCVQSGSVYMYADDTTLYCIRKTIDNMSAALNKTLIELYACCMSNKLISHPNKLEYMLGYRGLFTAPSHPCTLPEIT